MTNCPSPKDSGSMTAESRAVKTESPTAPLEGETSAEVAVATVSSLEGMTIEEYSNRLFAEWGIGKKQQDNGVLLLVAPHDNPIRLGLRCGD